MASDSEQSAMVSWVLCSHLANEHLRLAIESCLNQSFSNYELIFIANGEKSLEVYNYASRFFGHDSRVRIFVTSVRQLSFSLSLALHHARGEFIARMDSDDVSHPQRLERQVNFMKKNPGVAVLGTNYEIIDNDGRCLQQIRLPQSNISIRQALLLGNPFCHPSVMFRKQVVLDAGGYLGGLHAEDYDLWARLSLKKEIGFKNLNEVCLSYRVVGSGSARRSRWAYASMASTQFRNFLVGGGIRWMFASMISITKLILRSSPIRNF